MLSTKSARGLDSAEERKQAKDRLRAALMDAVKLRSDATSLTAGITKR